MPGQAIPLTRPRSLPPNGRIAYPIRSDIIDYRVPGHHLHDPLARGRLQIDAGKAGLQASILDEDPPPQPLTECELLGGGGFGTADTPAAGATTVVATPIFTFPFLITAVWAWANTTATGARVAVRVSPNNNTAAGAAEDGIDVLTPPNVLATIDVFNSAIVFYPNFLVAQPNQFIKLILVEPGGGGVAISIRGSWKRLA